MVIPPWLSLALPPLSVIAFVVLVVLVAMQRLWELGRSRRNESLMKAMGGREHARGQMPWMRALHFAWLVAMPLEVLALARPFDASLAVGAVVVFVAGQALRLAAMSALGDRWCVKVITLPRAPSVDGGIFRFIRHPNYLGVVLEIAALPLIHGAWITAAVFTVANGVLLGFRIRAEEAALRLDNDYERDLGGRPRWFPRFGGPIQAERESDA
jgi:methyltransferase